jgi:hypothetical protein
MVFHSLLFQIKALNRKAAHSRQVWKLAVEELGALSSGAQVMFFIGRGLEEFRCDCRLRMCRELPDCFVDFG